jgi:hypothetical protein
MLESTDKNIDAKLSEKEKEIQLLRQRDSMIRMPSQAYRIN